MFEGAREIPGRVRSAAASRYAAGVALFALIVAAAALTAEAGWGLWLNVVVVGGAAAGVLVLVGRLREREARLERSRAELFAALHSSDDGICLVDREGRITFANVAMTRLWDELGLPAEGTVWDRLAALANQTDRPERLLAAFARLAEDPLLKIEEEAEVVTAGRSFLGRTAPVVDRSGELFGRVFRLRETTAERRAERLKDELVATVSHELRTPLTAVTGFLDVVLDGHSGPLTDEQRRFLGIARRSSDRLVRLVGDLLFTAKVEAGRLTIADGSVDLDEIAAACVDDLSATAEQRGVDLLLGNDEVMPFRGDPDRVRQLLDNLVTNALKFTPAGGSILVRTGVVAGRALLEVQDSGIGIPEDEIGHLFERFFRASTAVERQLPGTGLGLRICKAIVDAHGGTIRVESDEGHGSTFRVELPLRPALVPARVKVA